jgi:hypothetical protein
MPKHTAKKAMMRHEKTESKKEMVKEYGKKAAAKKMVARKATKSDGMLSSKEAGKVYKKATNKKGKFDPTKIPGFSYGKGTR